MDIHNNHLKEFEAKEGIKLGIYLKDLSSNREFSWRANNNFESSSTIKIPVMFHALKKAQTEQDGLNQLLDILPEDMHMGSGIIYWTNLRQCSVYDLLVYTAKYSDCVATNTLIRYLGGKQKLNSLLAQKFSSTRLVMCPLNFDKPTNTMQKVGITTPLQMAQLFNISFNNSDQLQHIFRNLTSDVSTSFFQEALHRSNIKPHKLWHKTGSMFNEGELGDTCFNAAGVIENINGHKTLFSLYSRGNLLQPGKTTKTSQEAYASKITDAFWAIYQQFNIIKSPSNKVTIHEAKPTDIRPFMQMCVPVFIKTYAESPFTHSSMFDEEKFMSSSNQEYFNELLLSPNGHGFIARIGNEIVGGIGMQLTDGRWHIGAYYVSIHHQGMGIGGMLWQKAEKHMGNAPAYLEVISTASKAISLYQKWGFKLDPAMPVTRQRYLWCPQRTYRVYHMIRSR